MVIYQQSHTIGIKNCHTTNGPSASHETLACAISWCTIQVKSQNSIRGTSVGWRADASCAVVVVVVVVVICGQYSECRGACGDKGG